MEKTHRIGTLDRRGVFVEIRLEGERLSISGYTRQRYNSDWYSGGQIIDDIASVANFAPGWTATKRNKLVDVWQRWHLNDMRAGCEHQRAAEWDKVPMDESQPLNTYGYFGGSTATWNMAGWIRRSENPKGLMCEPCWICGYKYGTAWLMEELPAEVHDYIMELLA